MFPVTMFDFSTNSHFKACSAILARVNSSQSGDLSYPIHHVKKKVKKMKFFQPSEDILCFIFPLSTHSIF